MRIRIGEARIEIEGYFLALINTIEHSGEACPAGGQLIGLAPDTDSVAKSAMGQLSTAWFARYPIPFSEILKDARLVDLNVLKTWSNDYLKQREISAQQKYALSVSNEWTKQVSLCQLAEQLVKSKNNRDLVGFYLPTKLFADVLRSVYEAFAIGDELPKRALVGLSEPLTTQIADLTAGIATLALYYDVGMPVERTALHAIVLALVDKIDHLENIFMDYRSSVVKDATKSEMELARFYELIKQLREQVPICISVADHAASPGRRLYRGMTSVQPNEVADAKSDKIPYTLLAALSPGGEENPNSQNVMAQDFDEERSSFGDRLRAGPGSDASTDSTELEKGKKLFRAVESPEERVSSRGTFGNLRIPCNLEKLKMTADFAISNMKDLTAHITGKKIQVLKYGHTCVLPSFADQLRELEDLLECTREYQSIFSDPIRNETFGVDVQARDRIIAVVEGIQDELDDGEKVIRAADLSVAAGTRAVVDCANACCGSNVDTIADTIAKLGRASAETQRVRERISQSFGAVRRKLSDSRKDIIRIIDADYHNMCNRLFDARKDHMVLKGEVDSLEASLDHLERSSSNPATRVLTEAVRRLFAQVSDRQNEMVSDFKDFMNLEIDADQVIKSFSSGDLSAKEYEAIREKVLIPSPVLAKSAKLRSDLEACKSLLSLSASAKLSDAMESQNHAIYQKADALENDINNWLLRPPFSLGEYVQADDALDAGAAILDSLAANRARALSLEAKINSMGQEIKGIDCNAESFQMSNYLAKVHEYSNLYENYSNEMHALEQAVRDSSTAFQKAQADMLALIHFKDIREIHGQQRKVYENDENALKSAADELETLGCIEISTPGDSISIRFSDEHGQMTSLIKICLEKYAKLGTLLKELDGVDLMHSGISDANMKTANAVNELIKTLGDDRKSINESADRFFNRMKSQANEITKPLLEEKVKIGYSLGNFFGRKRYFELLDAQSKGKVDELKRKVKSLNIKYKTRSQKGKQGELICALEQLAADYNTIRGLRSDTTEKSKIDEHIKGIGKLLDRMNSVNSAPEWVSISENYMNVLDNKLEISARDDTIRNYEEICSDLSAISNWISNLEDAANEAGSVAKTYEDELVAFLDECTKVVSAGRNINSIISQRKTDVLNELEMLTKSYTDDLKYINSFENSITGRTSSNEGETAHVLPATPFITEGNLINQATVAAFQMITEKYDAAKSKAIIARSIVEALDKQLEGMNTLTVTEPFERKVTNESLAESDVNWKNEVQRVVQNNAQYRELIMSRNDKYSTYLEELKFAQEAHKNLEECANTLMLSEKLDNLIYCPTTDFELAGRSALNEPQLQDCAESFRMSKSCSDVSAHLSGPSTELLTISDYFIEDMKLELAKDAIVSKKACELLVTTLRKFWFWPENHPADSDSMISMTQSYKESVLELISCCEQNHVQYEAFKTRLHQFIHATNAVSRSFDEDGVGCPEKTNSQYQANLTSQNLESVNSTMQMRSHSYGMMKYNAALFTSVSGDVVNMIQKDYIQCSGRSLDGLASGIPALHNKIQQIETKLRPISISEGIDNTVQKCIDSLQESCTTVGATLRSIEDDIKKAKYNLEKDYESGHKVLVHSSKAFQKLSEELIETERRLTKMLEQAIITERNQRKAAVANASNCISNIDRSGLPMVHELRSFFEQIYSPQRAAMLLSYMGKEEEGKPSIVTATSLEEMEVRLEGIKNNLKAAVVAYEAELEKSTSYPKCPKSDDFSNIMTTYSRVIEDVEQKHETALKEMKSITVTDKMMRETVYAKATSMKTACTKMLASVLQLDCANKPSGPNILGESVLALEQIVKNLEDPESDSALLTIKKDIKEYQLKVHAIASKAEELEKAIPRLEVELLRVHDSLGENSGSESQTCENTPEGYEQMSRIASGEAPDLNTLVGFLKRADALLSEALATHEAAGKLCKIKNELLDSLTTHETNLQKLHQQKRNLELLQKNDSAFHSEITDTFTNADNSSFQDLLLKAFRDLKNGPIPPCVPACKGNQDADGGYQITALNCTPSEARSHIQLLILLRANEELKRRYDDLRSGQEPDPLLPYLRCASDHVAQNTELLSTIQDPSTKNLRYTGPLDMIRKAATLTEKLVRIFPEQPEFTKAILANAKKISDTSITDLIPSINHECKFQLVPSFNSHFWLVRPYSNYAISGSSDAIAFSLLNYLNNASIHDDRTCLACKYNKRVAKEFLIGRGKQYADTVIGNLLILVNSLIYAPQANIVTKPTIQSESGSGKAAAVSVAKINWNEVYPNEALTHTCRNGHVEAKLIREKLNALANPSFKQTNESARIDADSSTRIVQAWKQLWSHVEPNHLASLNPQEITSVVMSNIDPVTFSSTLVRNIQNNKMQKNLTPEPRFTFLIPPKQIASSIPEAFDAALSKSYSSKNRLTSVNVNDTPIGLSVAKYPAATNIEDPVIKEWYNDITKRLYFTLAFAGSTSNKPNNSPLVTFTADLTKDVQDTLLKNLRFDPKMLGNAPLAVKRIYDGNSKWAIMNAHTAVRNPSDLYLSTCVHIASAINDCNLLSPPSFSSPATEASLQMGSILHTITHWVNNINSVLMDGSKQYDTDVDERSPPPALAINTADAPSRTGENGGTSTGANTKKNYHRTANMTHSTMNELFEHISGNRNKSTPESQFQHNHEMYAYHSSALLKAIMSNFAIMMLDKKGVVCSEKEIAILLICLKLLNQQAEGSPNNYSVIAAQNLKSPHLKPQQVLSTLMEVSLATDPVRKAFGEAAEMMKASNGSVAASEQERTIDPRIRGEDYDEIIASLSNLTLLTPKASDMQAYLPLFYLAIIRAYCLPQFWSKITASQMSQSCLNHLLNEPTSRLSRPTLDAISDTLNRK